MERLKTITVALMQQTSDEYFRRQMFPVLEMDASEPVKSGVLMQNTCPAEIPC